MILEGIVTTVNEDGSANISPMGPTVDADMRRLILRPYASSTTGANLRRTGQGVLHVTDDVELLARCAVGVLDPPPPMRPAEAVDGWILQDACRWLAFRIQEIDDGAQPSRMTAEVVARGRHRDFFGFNRAKHAVVEAAILATRTDLLPPEHILTDFQRLAVLVEKTGGDQERSAFEFLQQYVQTALAAKTSSHNDH